MPAAKVVVSVPFKTGLPEDVSQNVWSFEIEDDTEPNYIEVAGFISAFYNELAPFFSEVCDPQNATMSLTIRSDATPQVPRFTTPIDLGPPSAVEPLPEEVAVVLSFRGVPLSGTVAARRRGRVYLGPIPSAFVTVGTDLRTAVSSGLIGAVEAATVAANAELTTAGNFHTIWSQTDQENVVVSEYWMDNAFDTQRRRGTAATSRTTWSV